MKRTSSTFSSLVALGLIVLVLLGWWKVQALEDWVKLRNYSPPAAVSALASEDTMTPQAIHDFYVNHPQLLTDTTIYNQDCQTTEQAIVLGCYHPDQNGIFIHDVTDTRLHGINQVTAAHEMLHAAYDRLSNKERKYVDGLLEGYYKNDLTDQRIIDEINSYKQTEPNDVVNEMHSVFGTEAANLPTPLENYYKQYFTDRAQIVGFADNYQGEFTTRISEINADDAQLADLKNKITSEEASLQAQLSKINSDRGQLSQERASGQVDQYNAGVAAFNQEVDNYNSGVAGLQADIASYNDLVNSRNAIADEVRSLDSAIDTRLTTQTQQ